METAHVKTEQRQRYEAEVTAIRRRFGDLEDMRQRLGLSQRRMAELLLVDPSAWTRWVKNTQAPPHVYRALSWYLELNEKSAASAAAPTLTEAPDLRAELKVEITQLKEHYEAELETLRQQNLLEKAAREKSEQITLGWKFFLMLNTAILVYLIFSSFL